MIISTELEMSLNFAINEAKKYGHEFVTVEHILYALLQDSEYSNIVIACGGSVQQTFQDLIHYFKTHLDNNIIDASIAPQPTLSFQRVLKRAAQQVLSAGKEKIYGDAVIVAMFSEKESFAAYFLEKQNITRLDVINFLSHGIVKEGVDPELLEESTGISPTYHQNPQSSPPAFDPLEGEERTDSKLPPKKVKQDPLSLFTENLCEKARLGKIDPLIGRDPEIERSIQVLSRRRKNNPLLVGDSGVGKTALVEGLASRIVDNKVPEVLKGACIYSLDLGTLVAGTKYRGDFEERLKKLVLAIKKIPKAILFIDEIHTIVGAGAVSGGALDASNILKPFLSSGEIRCIGSTTYKEYRQHFESDHALNRRFQKINIDEPSMEDSFKILKGLKTRYEEFHHVVYSDEALRGAVELSSRYMKDRFLPDKAIDIIDEVGASFAAKGIEVTDKPHSVNLSDVKRVIARIARVPPESLNASDKQSLKNLDAELKTVIFGQDKSIHALVNSIRMSRSGMGNDDKPIGSFLFSGPTGVGKTELAKQLAKKLGIEFIRFDMSEYMERHAVSRLIGAPPGYVGYDEGGLLTDSVHKNPHAVLLLDEIEKAHGDVHNILLQIMDHGTLTDSNGRAADFRNVILIMTTNVGAAELSKGSIGFNDVRKESKEDSGREKTAINNAFTPEFRNRLDAVLSFGFLPESVVLKIVDKFLADVEKKLAAKRVSWDLSLAARQYLAREGYDPHYGARPLERFIHEKIKKPLVEELLFGALSKGGFVRIDFVDGALSFKFEEKLKRRKEKENEKELEIA